MAKKRITMAPKRPKIIRKKTPKRPVLATISKPPVLPKEAGPPPQKPETVSRAVKKLFEADVKRLSKEVNEIGDPGFEDLFNNLPVLIEMYPKKRQFPLALRSKNEGNEDLARQALRNGLVDIE